MGAISISEKWRADDASAEVVDLVPWNERLFVANSLVGGWLNVGGFFTYIFPAVYSDNPYLVCKEVSYEWNGDIDSNTGDWLNARGTFSFGKPDTQVVDFGEINLDLSAQALSLPGIDFRWASGPDEGKKLTGEDVTPQAISPLMEIKLKRKSPFLFLSPIINTVGRLNSGPMFVNGYSFDDSFVLFAGATVGRKITSEGSDLWDYDLKFIAKPYSWNQFFHKSGTLQEIDPLIYGYGDLDFFFS